MVISLEREGVGEEMDKTDLMSRKKEGAASWFARDCKGLQVTVRRGGPGSFSWIPFRAKQRGIISAAP